MHHTLESRGERLDDARPQNRLGMVDSVLDSNATPNAYERQENQRNIELPILLRFIGTAADICLHWNILAQKKRPAPERIISTKQNGSVWRAILF
jgi:hypothetical protein